MMRRCVRLCRTGGFAGQVGVPAARETTAAMLMHKNVLGFFIGGFSYPPHPSLLPPGERVKKDKKQRHWIPDRVGDDRKGKINESRFIERGGQIIRWWIE